VTKDNNGLSEKELEDLFCARPPQLALWTPADRPLYIIDRQVALPHGILDVLAWDGLLYVIELKCGAILEKHIGQVLRYTADVRNGLAWAALQTFDEASPLPSLTVHGDLSKYIAAQHFDQSHGITGDSQMIFPVLIGKEINEGVLAAAEQAKISVYFWMEEGGSIYLEDTSPASFFYDDFLQGRIPSWLTQTHRIMLTSVEADAKRDYEESLQALFRPRIEL
jgi:hypothetical protein